MNDEQSRQPLDVADEQNSYGNGTGNSTANAEVQAQPGDRDAGSNGVTAEAENASDTGSTGADTEASPASGTSGADATVDNGSAGAVAEGSFVGDSDDAVDAGATDNGADFEAAAPAPEAPEASGAESRSASASDAGAVGHPSSNSAARPFRGTGPDDDRQQEGQYDDEPPTEMVIRSARDPHLNDVAANASMEDLLRASEQQYRTLKHGDVIEGSVMKLGRDEILVDIGAKTEGIIPNHELQSLSESEREALQVGDGLLVSVLQPENNEGHAVLSLDRARQEKSWRDLQKTFEAGEVIQAKVTGHNKGGLLVNLEGVRGFVPSSQVSSMPAGEANKQAEMARLQNQTLPLKIIEINRNRNRLILSERQAVQEQRETMRTRLLKELEPGQVRPGTVTSICDFGAFVDIGGADGLIHLSELSWKRVNHPSEVLKVGDRVNVHVLSVDPTERKIALSLKRTEPEPWSTITENYQLGQNVRGTITQLTSFGAFARLEDGIEGLIHVSELAEGRVAHPRNVVHEGEVLDLKVIRIDPARRRIGLSLKRMQEGAEGGADRGEGAGGEGTDNQYGVTPGEPVQNQPLSQADQTEESPSALSQIPVALSAEREDEPTYDDEPMGALAQAFATRGISFANARNEAAATESLSPQAQIEETSVGEVYEADLLPVATTNLTAELVATYEAEAAPAAAETHETTEANAPEANAGETSAPDANASPEAPVEQEVASATESAGASTDDTQEPAAMMPAAADIEATPEDASASAAPSSEETNVQPSSGESLSDVADMPDVSPEQGSGEDALGAPSGSEGAPSVADNGNNPEAGAEDTEGAGGTNTEG